MAKVIFETVSGSMYTVDTTNKTIEGGRLLEPLRYMGESPSFLAGNRVMLALENGGSIMTTPIKKVHCVAKDAIERMQSAELDMDFTRQEL